MSTLLKDLYSAEFYKKLSDVLVETIPGFDKKKFNRLIFDKSWEAKELKDRMKHTAVILHHFFPADFTKAPALIEQIITSLRKKKFRDGSLEFMFFPDYIENYGIEHFDHAMHSFEFVTPFTSCEFAVRPFLLKYGDKMISQMIKWSKHENLHIRRLASEGSRPRLPWAMALPFLKKDPQPLLAILENLKNDPSEYVRRSVANNLNDITKDHPALVIQIARNWKGHSKETDAIIKHGSRTLLKQGHAGILDLYQLNSKEIKLLKFNIPMKKIRIGEYLEFSFDLQNNSKAEQLVRLEYAVFYLRQNAQLSKKVFKISEKILSPGQKINFTRKQSFKLITTRKFYPGKQSIALIINGKQQSLHSFELS